MGTQLARCNLPQSTPVINSSTQTQKSGFSQCMEVRLLPQPMTVFNGISGVLHLLKMVAVYMPNAVGFFQANLFEQLVLKLVRTLTAAFAGTLDRDGGSNPSLLTGPTLKSYKEAKALSGSFACF